MISVIIPVYNGAQTLPGCLRALQQQTLKPDEVIVVDDGSTDEIVNIAAKFNVTVISQANAGPASARNLGAQVAHGDVLVFTDADCVPAPNWVEQMVQPFLTPTITGAKGIYRTHQRELVPRFVQQEYQDRYDRMDRKSQIDFVDTYSAAYRRKPFLAAGGFDTTFSTASVEDQEFSFRLSKQGHQLVYVPRAIVYHQHDRTLAQYICRKYWIGYWKALVMRRHPSKLVHDSHTPQILKIQMGLAPIGGILILVGILFRNGAVLISGGLAWGLLLLSGASFYVKILRRDMPVLVVAPSLVFIRAWALGWGFFLGNLRLIFKGV